MSPARRGLIVAAAFACAVTAVGLLTRPLLPVDETRYASVAWEMWNSADWLVPHLNGVPYSDKPPLLFWLIVAGWHVIGVSTTSLRLVSPLCGVAALALVPLLARTLWPDRARVALLAPIACCGTLLWTVYATLTLFDTLLAVGTLTALLGLLLAWRRGPAGWALVAAGLGFGLLAKGPAALLHVLPVALLAPWWAADARGTRWGRWYLGLAVATLVGGALALAWALPAARAGGPEYADAILLRQTTGRLVSAFAHRRPVWWYLPLLPATLVPWILWPRAWRAILALRRSTPDAGVRFCVAWAAPAFVGFSLVSGKQVHYLLPLVPAAALLLSRALDEAVPDAPHRVTTLAAACAALVIAAHLVGKRDVLAGYDLMPAASAAAGLERLGRPVAFSDRYAGQLHFLGRLKRPFAVVPDEEAHGWLAAHPTGGVFVAERGPCRPGAGEHVILARRSEGRTLCLYGRDVAPATPAPTRP